MFYLHPEPLIIIIVIIITNNSNNNNNNNSNNNKAIVDIRLRPRGAISQPSSRPIERIACDQKF